MIVDQAIVVRTPVNINLELKQGASSQVGGHSQRVFRLPRQEQRPGFFELFKLEILCSPSH